MLLEIAVIAALPAALPLPGRLMGIFHSMLERAALLINHTRQDNLFRCSLTPQLVGYDHTRSAACGAQQLAKKVDRRPAIPFGLHENIEHTPVLVDRAPEVVRQAVDLQKHSVQM